MGEPLNNYDSVRTAVAMMTDSRLFALRRSAVTVSTVGVIPRILQVQLCHNVLASTASHNVLALLQSDP